MSSREIQLNVKEEVIGTNYEAQSPKDDNDESVDDMLSNVDQFIEGVYRDLSLSPPRKSTIDNTSTLHTSVDGELSSSSTTSPVGSSQLSGTTFKRENMPIGIPDMRRNMNAEIERINRICDNVDQNLRSIGLFMNDYSSNSSSDDFLNTTLNTTPSSSTSLIILNNTSPKLIRKSNLPRNPQVVISSPTRQLDVQIIDLSNSLTPTPETIRRPVHHNNGVDDDDVILVSANIPSVVDLCSPDDHQEMPPERPSVNYRHLNRRRLSTNIDIYAEDPSYEGPSSTRRRRIESSSTTSENNRSGFDIKPNINTKSTTNNASPTPFMCPICMESCLKRAPTSTVCGHVFCKSCIENAICYTHKCPMCNRKISKKNIFRIYL